MVIVAVIAALSMIIYFVIIITDSIKWAFPKKFPDELTGDKEFDRQQKMEGNAVNVPTKMLERGIRLAMPGWELFAERLSSRLEEKFLNIAT